jgi:hypothetical protein
VAFGFPEKNQVQQEKSKLSEFALNSATKIVQNFQNPKLPEEKTIKNIKKVTPSAALKQAIDSIDNTQQTKNQIKNSMKKTLTIALLLSSAMYCGARTHFPKNYMPSDTVHISIGHVENDLSRKEYEGK